MVLYHLFNSRLQGAEQGLVGGYECGFKTVAPGKILRSNHRDGVSGLGFDKKNLAVVIGKVGILNDLRNKSPQRESLVGCLMVEYQRKSGYSSGFFDKEKSAQELLRDGKRRLPYLRSTNLPENPFQNIGNLYGVVEINLEWGLVER